jgi:tetratricopeptide (TPR) repeat protein
VKCPDADHFLGYLRAALPPESMEELAAHFASCSDCRAILHELARSSLLGLPVPGSQPLARGAQVGRYVILDPVGSGAMGVVYAAYDPELDRRVALKLLRPEVASAEEGSARLWREARAMARLSHPHVIAAHDIGTADGRVFVAMEFVDGTTLRRWLEAERRDWRAVLAIFLQAGRGLAEAHAAGIVHRDFKPDNVLVGSDGRVRVTDFGLALTGAPTAPPSSDMDVTRTGQMVGTPAYMAPEQLRGGEATPASDQFGFCVALYEALHGERPFAGATLAELTEAVSGGHAREASVGPAWLRRSILRGLSPVPGDRHPSMAALLGEMERAQTRAPTRWWLAAGFLILAAFLGLRLRTRPAELCAGATPRLESLWNGDAKAAVERAFGAVKQPYAGQAFASASQSVDEFAGAWRAARTEVCQATRLRGEQSEALMDLRIRCLDDELQELSTLTEIWRSADAAVVRKAVSAAQALSRPKECVERRSLPVTKPPSPEEAARVDAARLVLARGKVFNDAGKYKDGLALSAGGLAEARALHHPPLLAEALYLHALLQTKLGDPAAEKTFREAAVVADAAQDDSLRARSWGNLVFALATANRFREAHELVPQMEAARARAGINPGLGAAIEMYLFDLGLIEGHFDEALVHAERALSLDQQAASGELRIATDLSAVSESLERLGRFSEALEHAQRAAAITERLLGPVHPKVASAILMMADADFDLGRLSDALALQQRALAILQETFGPEHPDVGRQLNHVGVVLEGMRRYPEAREHYRKSLAIAEKAYGRRHREVAMALNNIGNVYLAEKRPREALASYQAAEAIAAELAEGKDDSLWATTLNGMGGAWLRLGTLDRAAPALEKALTMMRKVDGADHPNVASVLLFLAEVAMARHNSGSAAALCEEALGIRLKHLPEAHGDVAAARFKLAEALWSNPATRARAVGLARQARDAWAQHPDAKEDAAEAEAWLAQHRE